MRSLPTASAIDRAMECVGSVVLPCVRSSSADSLSGTGAHSYLYRAREIGKQAALAEILDEDERARMLAIDLDSLPPGAGGEVSLAWNWRTGEGRVLGSNLGRNYPDLGPDWYIGTADLLGRSATMAIVLDYKTGNLIKRAAESWQLKSLALFACVAGKLDDAHVKNLYLGNDGKWRPDGATFDAFDLDAIAEELRWLADRIAVARDVVWQGELPELHDGPHCSYCPAMRSCPSVKALVRTAAGWEMESIGERFTEMAPADAGRAWEQIALVEKIVERAKSALKDRVKASPEGLPLSNGKVLKLMPWGTRAKNSPIATAELAQLKSELVARGEITDVAAFQIRAVLNKESK